MGSKFVNWLCPETLAGVFAKCANTDVLELSHCFITRYNIYDTFSNCVERPSTPFIGEIINIWVRLN